MVGKTGLTKEIIKIHNPLEIVDFFTIHYYSLLVKKHWFNKIKGLLRARKE